MTALVQPHRSAHMSPAHVIRSDAEAIAVAQKLAARFAVDASVRDRERRLPVGELDEFSASGLWGITVPKAYGGASFSYVTVAEVIKIISAADSEVAAALLERAEEFLTSGADDIEISIAAAESHLASAEALSTASNAEFQLTGQRTPLPGSLQDPLRWKLQLIGNFRLDGIHPPSLHTSSKGAV
ncbi:acyl-CoA dehydrogenase family protein [Pseudomonas sp. MYb330]|uniref:acyl-CoA dehydrogenase family protein n=1 Tax=unclassified Pseudomonas TaxID=196821 RepID=UPI00309EEB9C